MNIWIIVAIIAALLLLTILAFTSLKGKDPIASDYTQPHDPNDNDVEGTYIIDNGTLVPVRAKKSDIRRYCRSQCSGGTRSQRRTCRSQCKAQLA